MHFSPKRIKLNTIFVLSFFPLIGMGVDLLTPSLPAISETLNVSHIISKSLVAIFLLAYSIGNFFSGVLSDSIGRRWIIIGSFFIFVIGSLLPALFPHTSVLLVSRFLQGLMLASYGVVSRAMLSDLLEQEKLIRVVPFVAMAWGIGPIAGPVIGGYLQFYIGWQACFYFFSLYGFIGLIAAIFILPETHFNRQPLNYGQLKINVKTILSHRAFVGMAIIMGIYYSLLIVFNTLGPFLIQMRLDRSSIYFGHVALAMGIVFLSGTVVSRQLLKTFQPEQVLRVGILILLVLAIVSLGFAYADSENIWVILLPSFVMFWGCGILYPGAMGRCLSLFRNLAGNAIAVMNFLNVSITATTALIMSFISANSMIPLAWFYFGLVALSGFVFFRFVKKSTE